MYVGVPNPNVLMPLKKMTITNLDSSGGTIKVMYNPQSYNRSRSDIYSVVPLTVCDIPLVQYGGSKGESISFQLFFDGFSAGAEVGGSAADKALSAANSLLPSPLKRLDVAKQMDKIYQLMLLDPDLHRPPQLQLKWSTLEAQCLLVSCQQNYTKFNETGTPVRGTMDCVFLEAFSISKAMRKKARNSPDTTKFHRVREGDSLWKLAEREYGDSDGWRIIARENGISNPRNLRAGDMIRIPAI